MLLARLVPGQNNFAGLSWLHQLKRTEVIVYWKVMGDQIVCAAGLGDIGVYFPDTETEFKDIPSIKLLAKTYEIIREKEDEL